MLQETALRALQAGNNVFLTGSAGSGKTFLLNRYIRYLRLRDAKVAVTASTGIAATHIGGMTIHSWSGLGIKKTITAADLQTIAKKKPVRDRVRETRVLIIDEISMLSAQALTGIDQITRHLKGGDQPFGGMQVVFCGDFFQLPPVEREPMPARDKFAFMAPAWRGANLKICNLTEAHRHEDDDLMRLLNEIREGEVSVESRDKLNAKLNNAHTDRDAIKLFTHNVDADAANVAMLNGVAGEAARFEASSGGRQSLVDTLKKSVMAPECLELKKGAQVMFVKNNFERGYINGTLGKVAGFTDEGLPVVKTFDDQRIVASPVDWTVTDEQNAVIAFYKQVPLRLAWAITVHKSQGMTLDRVTLDLSKTFEPGQGYVALSRVKTWDGLGLLGYNQKALQVDSLALKADKRFRVLSSQAEDELARVDDAEMEEIFARHITRCGGTNDAEAIQRNKKTLDEARAPAAKRQPQPDTFILTKALIEEGLGVEEIATRRMLKPWTIITHLERLHAAHPDLDLSRFKPDDNTIAAVRAAFTNCAANATDDDRDQAGNIKLAVVRRALNEAFTYEEIRLARIFGADDGGQR